MKHITLISLIFLSFLMLFACGGVQKRNEKTQIKTYDSTFAQLREMGADSSEIAKIIQKLENPYNEPIPTADEVISSMMLITPNPTSSSVTIKFFNGFQNADLLIPCNFIVDLFYIDKKMHTFNFLESKGTEIIPESYLKEEGMYRVATEYNGITFVSTFMVIKK